MLRNECVFGSITDEWDAKIKLKKTNLKKAKTDLRIKSAVIGRFEGFNNNKLECIIVL
jgi:hypothetical protein